MHIVIFKYDKVILSFHCYCKIADHRNWTKYFGRSGKIFEQPVIESYKYFLNVIFIFKEFMSTILYINLAWHFYIEANRLYN